MADVTDDYLALRQEVGAVRLPRDVVRAAGPDTLTYLQGQLSQDLTPLALGESTWAFLLEPQGKVVAWLRATRTGDEEIVLDVDAGHGEPMIERLDRFKLRTDCTFEPVAWDCVAVRGPSADGARPDPTADVHVAVAGWPGLAGFDLLGPNVPLPDDVRDCGLDAYETVRIEAGVPAMGAELTDKTIPHEVGRWVIVGSVSFTKGCYTGQELVYRIDSRGGNVPRHLRGIVVGTNVLPPVGAEVVVEGQSMGALTSVGESLERRAPVALGYIRRAVEPPAAAELRWNGTDGVPCTIEALPLVGDGDEPSVGD
ncbi:MAG: YgfZ/GcvT domain-containing protein [Acidimicrobiales bacterium]